MRGRRGQRRRDACGRGDSLVFGAPPQAEQDEHHPDANHAGTHRRNGCLRAMGVDHLGREQATCPEGGSVAMVTLGLVNGTPTGLEHEFTAADLILTTVLRNLRNTTLVKDNAVLCAYQARCESRPAFRRALDAQLAPFARYAPAA